MKHASQQHPRQSQFQEYHGKEYDEPQSCRESHGLKPRTRYLAVKKLGVSIRIPFTIPLKAKSGDNKRNVSHNHSSLGKYRSKSSHLSRRRTKTRAQQLSGVISSMDKESTSHIPTSKRNPGYTSKVGANLCPTPIL
ncbi:hypothetical protein ACH5RR_023691 [Cinchona calisaya]|uniref:Uncharacterized protein n=1 Tax=Cinchona calisaya TaxID=153742 RepID=A0ABD2ZCV5_9GENT